MNAEQVGQRCPKDELVENEEPQEEHNPIAQIPMQDKAQLEEEANKAKAGCGKKRGRKAGAKNVSKAKQEAKPETRVSYATVTS